MQLDVLTVEVPFKESKDDEQGVNEVLVMGVNKVTNWCRIATGRGTYTCPTKVIDGQLFFAFKKAWHPVAAYISEHAHELVEEGGRLFSRPFRQ